MQQISDADIKMGMGRARIPFCLLIFTCAQIAYAPCVFAGPHDTLISKHAATYGVPEALVRRVIRIESGGNARVVSKGNYGLMQIRLGTARAMGYRGTEAGLLDADTNMTYAVKYLAGAYRAAGCNESRAISYYQRGYYGASRTKCPAVAPTTQIAERRDDMAKPAAARIAPAAPVLAAASTEPVQMRPRPKPVTDSTGSIQARPAAQASNDVMIAPIARPALEPAPTQSVVALAPEALRLPRARPAEKRPAGPAVAALEPAAVPMPMAKPPIGSAIEQQPVHNPPRNRSRPSRRVSAQPSFLTALKQFFAPQQRSSRRHVARR